ncbi:MAG TPA: YdjY domain-containing protein [Deltaproteobacteria bacterium]|nr:YdjY domain-containing protein [Deltaproteobacteria bacterium]HXK48146.1 YdjY domain-containing protein [Deltaproteobacteria bacterium]
MGRDAAGAVPHEPVSRHRAAEDIKVQDRNGHEPDTGLSRRDFLVKALLASGAVIAGHRGMLHAATIAGGSRADWPTRGRPLAEDLPGRTVMMYAELSLEHLTRTTAHWGIGCGRGACADKFILVSPAEPIDLHDALVRVGGRPGNNLTMESYGDVVAGDPLAVSVLWHGLEKPLGLKDVFHDGAGGGFMMRFGGNREAALRHNTGCLTCLESCPVGITSNAAYPHIRGIRRALTPNSTFRGRPETLPRKEAFPLVVCYRLDVQ